MDDIVGDYLHTIVGWWDDGGITRGKNNLFG
jgi:hypothetical protein